MIFLAWQRGKGAFDSFTGLRLREMQVKGAWMVGFHAWSGTVAEFLFVLDFVEENAYINSHCDTIAGHIKALLRHCCWHCCNLSYRIEICCTWSENCNSGGQYAALQAAVHGGVVYTGQGAGREPAGSPWCKTHRSEIEKIVWECVRHEIDPLRSRWTWNNYEWSRR